MAAETWSKVLEISDNHSAASSLVSPSLIVRAYATQSELRELVDIVIQGCQRPTFLPVTKSWMAKRDLPEIEDGVHIIGFILSHAVQILLFAPTDFITVKYSPDTSAYKHRYPSPSIYGQDDDYTVCGRFSLEDLHRSVTLLLHTRYRRLSNRNIFTQKTPPIPKEETFKGYWNPAHNKIIGMPFRGPVQGNHILYNFIHYKMKYGQQALPLVPEGDTTMYMNGDDADNATEAASLPLYCDAFKRIIMTNIAGARQSKLLKLDLEEFIFPDDDTFDMLFATACRIHRYSPPNQDVKTVVKDFRAYFNFPVGKVITYELNVACPHSYDAMWSKLHSERRFTDLRDVAFIGAVDMRDAYMIMSDNAKYFGTSPSKALECLQSLELTSSDTDDNPCPIVDVMKNDLSFGFEFYYFLLPENEDTIPLSPAQWLYYFNHLSPCGAQLVEICRRLLKENESVVIHCSITWLRLKLFSLLSMAAIDVFVCDVIENFAESTAIQTFVDAESAPHVCILNLHALPQGLHLGTRCHHIISIDAWESMESMQKTLSTIQASNEPIWHLLKVNGTIHDDAYAALWREYAKALIANMPDWFSYEVQEVIAYEHLKAYFAYDLNPLARIILADIKREATKTDIKQLDDGFMARFSRIISCVAKFAINSLCRKKIWKQYDNCFLIAAYRLAQLTSIPAHKLDILLYTDQKDLLQHFKELLLAELAVVQTNGGSIEVEVIILYGICERQTGETSTFQNHSKYSISQKSSGQAPTQLKSGPFSYEYLTKTPGPGSQSNEVATESPAEDEMEWEGFRD